MTKSHGSRAMAVVISSTMPSTKYSCSASPVMFWNGNTANDGLSGSGSAMGWDTGVSPSCGPEARGPRHTANACTGLVMFLTCCSPRSSKAMSRRSRPPPCAPGPGQNPPRPGTPFEPGCNVDAVAKDVAILDDDVADIDAHAKFDAALGRSCGVAGDHLLLHLDRAAHRIDDAGELGKEAVAGRLDDATAMLGDFGIAEFTANRPQRRQGALFARAHQPRIARDIDRQNGRQPALDPPLAHSSGSPSHRRSAV